jgi:hypothetical protein
LVNLPAAKTPHIKAEPTLLAELILWTLEDLQFGHLILDDIGLPQLGELSAEDEISLLQSGQVIKAIIYFFMINESIATIDVMIAIAIAQNFCFLVFL